MGRDIFVQRIHIFVPEALGLKAFFLGPLSSLGCLVVLTLPEQCPTAFCLAITAEQLSYWREVMT